MKETTASATSSSVRSVQVPRPWLAGALLLIGTLPAAAGPVDYGSVVLADNPRGYFRLDEATGAAIALNDAGASGGTGMNGTYENAPSLGVAGIPGAAPNTAVTMNASANQRVTSISDSYGYTALSLEAWVRTSSTAGQGLIVRTDSSGPNSDWGSNLRIVNNNGSAHFSMYFYDGNAKGFVADAQVTPGDLYHVVATALNGGGMSLYVNGLVQTGTYFYEGSAQSSPLTLNSLWNGDRWYLGSTAGGGGRDPFVQGFLDGSLDEVAIYPTLLSPIEIQSHYSAGLTSAAVPEIDPSGMGSVLALVAGAVGLLERRRMKAA